MKIFEELKLRGLIKQTTNDEHISSLLDKDSVNFYIGFDPTADSLHVGHLLQVITAKRLQNAGHNPIMLIGGATALIGDPTGKSEARQILSEFEINKNAKLFENQIKSIFKTEVKLINNIEWFKEKNFLDIIRDLGPFFSVNNMLRAECFKSRFEKGLSFLEFNYMILQSEDFRQLFLNQKCLIQIGGDDQWSNILAGIDLIHKKEKGKAYGITVPLLIKSDGTKMGKTEKGAVWLDENKTSIFDFFQFWRNISDDQVIKCFKMLTFLSLEEIDKIPFNNTHDINSAKKTLAHCITEIVHGKAKADLALEQSKSIFEDKSFDESFILKDSINIVDLLVLCKFAKSKSDARNLINGNGISINQKNIKDIHLLVSEAEFSKHFVIKKGKKNYLKITFEK